MVGSHDSIGCPQLQTPCPTERRRWRSRCRVSGIHFSGRHTRTRGLGHTEPVPIIHWGACGSPSEQAQEKSPVARSCVHCSLMAVLQAFPHCRRRGSRGVAKGHGVCVSPLFRLSCRVEGFQRSSAATGWHLRHRPGTLTEPQLSLVVKSSLSADCEGRAAKRGRIEFRACVACPTERTLRQGPQRAKRQQVGGAACPASPQQTKQHSMCSRPGKGTPQRSAAHSLHVQ